MKKKSLWGDDFIVNKSTKSKDKAALSKINHPITVESTVKLINSKKISIEDKLELIKSEVNRILGVYKENTVVIKTKDELRKYIDLAIINGELAVDTETNNSLDPITCKLMGLCLYTPGMKNAYIPVNHIDRLTNNKLIDQVTEMDIAEELNRLAPNNVKNIMHNGKFDYAVIKCTCGVCLDIYWDTLIGVKLLDENEKDAGLKYQYIHKIDSSIEKYDIEHLFQKLPYEIVDPDIFALYAATDSFMTYKLYKYQLNEFMKPGNEKIYNLFTTIEMPLVKVISELEMAGMEIDLDYVQGLSNKYHKQLDSIDKDIDAELLRIKPQIDAWRTTPNAMRKVMYYQDKATFGDLKLFERNIYHDSDIDYNYFIAQGIKNFDKKNIKFTKSKSEQLDEHINLSSPVQLAILFYDIFMCPLPKKHGKEYRGTGEEELTILSEKMDLPIVKLLLKRRAIVKLLTTYIDIMPELTSRWPDGRVRTHFQQYGAKTGRLSSSLPINFLNIPSHNKEIRLIFKAKETYSNIPLTDNYYDIDVFDEVKTPNGWVSCNQLNIGDLICTDTSDKIITAINHIGDKRVRLYI